LDLKEADYCELDLLVEMAEPDLLSEGYEDPKGKQSRL
jgi:hypothetical protein